MCNDMHLYAQNSKRKPKNTIIIRVGSEQAPNLVTPTYWWTVNA